MEGQNITDTALMAALRDRLEHVNAHIAERQDIIIKYAGDDNVDHALASGLATILEQDLQDEAKWIRGLIGDGHE